MDGKQAKNNLAALDRIRAQVVTLRDAEEGVAMKGDLDNLLLPIDQLRRTMMMRSDALAQIRARGIVEGDGIFVSRRAAQ
jgi:hypothetical protein